MADRARDWRRATARPAYGGGIPPEERSRSAYGGGTPQYESGSPFGPDVHTGPTWQMGYDAGYRAGWDAHVIKTETERFVAPAGAAHTRPAGVDWGLVAKVLALTASPVAGEADAARRKLAQLLLPGFPSVKGAADHAPPHPPAP